MAAPLFGVVVAVILFSRTAIQTIALRDGVLLPDVDREQYRRGLAVSWSVTGYWVLTLAFIWWAPWSGISWSFTSWVGTGAQRLARRRPSRALSGGAG
jgi:hypothetical protein